MAMNTAQGESGAVLTAGSHPVLRATAMRLAKRRTRITVCDATMEGLQSLEVELAGESSAILSLPSRITDGVDVRHVVEAVTRRFDKISAFIKGFVDHEVALQVLTASKPHMMVVQSTFSPTVTATLIEVLSR